MYSIEELEKVFKENSILCVIENARALEEFKQNCPDQPIPEYFTRDFCINTALAAMCNEILSIKEIIKWNGYGWIHENTCPAKPLS